MTNGLANGLWKGALKSAVSVACGVIVGEAATGDLQTWHGWVHVGTVILTAVIVREATYWKNWADNSSEGKGT